MTTQRHTWLVKYSGEFLLGALLAIALLMAFAPEINALMGGE